MIVGIHKTAVPAAQIVTDYDDSVVQKEMLEERKMIVCGLASE
jgi:hypothetical protein